MSAGEVYGVFVTFLNVFMPAITVTLAVVAVGVVLIWIFKGLRG